MFSQTIKFFSTAIVAKIQGRVKRLDGDQIRRDARLRVTKLFIWNRLRACVSLLALVSLPVFAAPLNDTGIYFCSDNAINGMDCGTVATDGGLRPRQDARFGRDAAAAAWQLTKVGGGGKGFDYSKIANNGSALPESAALGTGATDWACTRDNVTGLIWEVKTDDNGLRDKDHTYTWYSSDAATNGGNAGSTGADTCNSTLPSNLCNTEAFVVAVNAAGLCGYSDWRMPNAKELEGIADLGRVNPAIDPTYFPNIPSSRFWTSSITSVVGSSVWNVNFADGSSDYLNFGFRGQARAVRLVRDGE